VPDLLTITVELEQHTVTLVQQAPDLDPGVVELAARAALVAATQAAGELIRLALVIERVLDDLAAGEIALGVGLPAAAMAAYSLQQAVTAGAAADPLAVRGAIYELETMTPVPATGRRPTVDEPRPDVPVTQLTSKLPPPARRPDHAAAARARRLASIGGEVPDAVLAAVGLERARYTRA